MSEAPSMNVAKAWTIFWAEQGPGSRCLANAPPEMLEPLNTHWHTLASSFSSATNVLDLGCGAGAVGRELLTAQPHLHVTGIDIALIPVSSDPRIDLLPWTPMESLPFDDASLDAAVSQFGYEYGRTEEAANEVARVLAPSAPISFLIHHSESPLVSGMRLHKRAIDGLCGPQMNKAFAAGDAAALREQLEQLKRECPSDPTIDQAARGLQVHIRQNEHRRHDIWNAVAEALEPERIMLEALDLCCIGHHDVDLWLGPLRKAFDLRAPRVVRMRSGEPIAWVIEGSRRAPAQTDGYSPNG